MNVKRFDMRHAAILVFTLLVGCATAPSKDDAMEICEQEYRVLAIYCFNYHGGNKLPEMCKKWARNTAPSCPD